MRPLGYVVSSGEKEVCRLIASLSQTHAPIVKLEEIAVTIGEEDETSILDLYVSLSSLSHSLYSYGFPFFFIAIWLNLGIFYFAAKLNFTHFSSGSVKFLKHKEHQRRDREKTNKIINRSAIVTVHIGTVTVAIVHKWTIMHKLVWVFFCSDCVKLATFSILHNYAQADVIALMSIFLMVKLL